MKAKETHNTAETFQGKPLLMVDIDGVISLFGAPQIEDLQASAGVRPGAPTDAQTLEGRFCSIDGIPHFLSLSAAAHLLALTEVFDVVWASGWEERANEHLPHLLGVPAELPFLRFSGEPDELGSKHAHWKLQAIDSYAGGRPLAWIDDNLNAACQDWANARSAPTLLVATVPEHGLTSHETRLLMAWAGKLQRR